MGIVKLSLELFVVTWLRRCAKVRDHASHAAYAAPMQYESVSVTSGLGSRTLTTVDHLARPDSLPDFVCKLTAHTQHAHAIEIRPKVLDSSKLRVGVES